MKVKDNYPKVMRELYQFKILQRSQIIADVTHNQVTPEIESCVEDLCRMDGIGRMVAIELLFAIGINCEC